MENKKTTELMSRKSTLKSKLMAAVSMLLVSAIMVSVTTYAWFILSTAPEVKGMSTTVGSNGALEMALLDNATGIDLSKITSAVGDSSAKKSVVEANKTWGNLVDLNDASYGLSGITMYPARLNWAPGSNTNLVSRNNLLAYAQYGTDGRIADLVAASSGTHVTGGFAANPDSYGVRAIGTAKAQAAEAAALERAQANYANFMSAASSKAVGALNSSAQSIAEIAITRGTKTGNDEVYTKAQLTDMKTALAGLHDATDNIVTALKWAAVAKAASENDIITIDKVDLTNDTNYRNLQTLVQKIEAQQTTANSLTDKETYTWEEIDSILSALLNVESITIGEGDNAKTSNELKDMKQNDINGLLDWWDHLGTVAVLNVKGGLFSETADFVDMISSTEKAHISLEAQLLGQTVHREKDATINANKTISDDAYLVALKALVNGYKYTPAEGGEDDSKPFINDTYGYAVDLAFRSNAKGELRLSDVAKRVSGSSDPALDGGGSYFTANAGADTNALAALRIAFVDKTNKVLAVGKLAATATDGSKYAVHLYEFNVANGVLTVTDTPIANDKLLDLTANEAVALTAVVYMDGDATSFAQGKASGSLNLQFCTSADLTAMSYNNYATAGLTFAGTETKTATMDTVPSPIAAPTKILMAGKELTPAQKENVTWTGDKDTVATVDTSTGKVTPVGPGEVTITATYKDGSGTHTGSYTLKVS